MGEISNAFGMMSLHSMTKRMLPISFTLFTEYQSLGRRLISTIPGKYMWYIMSKAVAK